MRLPREQFLAHLAELDQRYAEIEQQLADVSARAPDPQELQRLSKAKSNKDFLATMGKGS